MLVGRERELAQLRSRLERGEAVALLGEAGVGKTVLLREAAERSGRRLYEAGALATLSWLPYLPLERALGRKLAAGDAAWAAREVEREIADGVLLLDDLHWADRETRALLPFLYGRTTLATTLRRGDPGTEPALGELALLGIEPLALEPLGDEDSRALLAALRPDLSRPAADRILARAGGNPLLIEELARSGEPTESLRLALAARLRLLPPPAREAMGLLALAGRPLPSAVLGGEGDELVRAGLCTVEAGSVAVRHALIGETAAAELAVEVRRRLHAGLARLLEDPGEAARHHASAGEREQAFETAMQAAQAAATLGERGRHLALAASCADGADADRLRLSAARALIEGHDWHSVGQMLDEIVSDDRLVQAEADLRRYELLVVTMDFPAAKAAWTRGMEWAAGSGSEIETQLRIEAGRIAFLLDLDPRAVEIAEAGYTLARAREQHELLAHYILGSTQMHGRDPRWRPTLERAVAEARRTGETGIEYRAANNLVNGLVLDGDLERAHSVAVEAHARAGELRLGRWQQRMAVLLVGINWHLGALAEAADQGEVLVDDVFENLDRLLAVKYFAHVLVDIGRTTAALRLVEPVVGETGSEENPQEATLEVLGEALTIVAAAQFWAGRVRAALSTAERASGYYGDTSTSDTITMAAVLAAWSRFELGLPVEVALSDVPSPRVDAAAAEIEAVRELARGRARAAATHFDDAAALWRGSTFGSFLRCSWAAGEALRRTGATSDAIAALREVEALAREHGYAGLLVRVERALRLCGIRRTAARSQTGSGLTAREHEILALVGEGLSNQEIATRLGVGRPTVARIVQSASRKLGAETRLQAAALAARG